VKKKNPEEIAEFRLSDKHKEREINITELLTLTNLAGSKSEARRLVEQGGVTIDGKKIGGLKESIKLERDFVLKVGKRKFLKIKI